MPVQAALGRGQHQRPDHADGPPPRWGWRAPGTSTHRRLVEAHKHVYRVFNDVGKHVRKSAGVSLIAVQHGFQGVRDTKRTLNWKAEGSDETTLSVIFDVREAGDELVIDLSEVPVYRTSLASPRYEDAFDDALREVLITRLFEAVTGRD